MIFCYCFALHRCGLFQYFCVLFSLLQQLLIFVCSLWVASSDGSGFPAALHIFFLYVTYYLSNQFTVNKILLLLFFFFRAGRCLRSSTVLSQALRTHHPASPRPSLVAGPGTDSISSLRSGIPMS